MNKEEKIIAFLLEDLSEQEKSTFEQKLQQMPQATPELSEYTELLSAIDNHQAEIPSKNLRNNFEKMLSKEILDLRKKEKGRVVYFTPSFIRVATAAVAVLLIGIFIGYHMQTSQKQLVIHEIPMDAKLKNEFTTLINENRTSRRIQGVNLIETSKQIDDETLEAVQKIVLTDQSSNVRLAAIDALARHLENKAVKNFLLSALPEVNIPIVRIAIINHLTWTENKSAIPVFENMLDQDGLEKAVKDELHIGIRKLSSNI